MKSNFQFMEAYWPDMAHLGEAAESYLYSDPNACIYKLGLLGEQLVSELLSYEKIIIGEGATHAEKILAAKRKGLLPQNIDDILYALRKGRNEAVHNSTGSIDNAKTLLRMTYRLCTWFMEVYGDWKYQPEDYHEPEDKLHGEDLLALIQEQEARLNELAEQIGAIPTEASEQDADQRREKAEAVAKSIELTAEEASILDAEQVRLYISSLPSVNFALHQNGLPLIRNIRIENNTGKELVDVTVRITSDPTFALEYKRTISFIPAKGKFELQEIDLHLDAAFLCGLTEKLTGALRVELTQNDLPLCTETTDITVLAFNEWSGYQIYPESLAAFVTPNHPEINRIVAKAVTFLEEWTKDPSLDGYQTKDVNRVRLQAAAIYKALQEQNIVYSEPPASFEKTGQRVRLCDEVLSQKMGTCLDLALLFTSCLEAIGLFPLLILQKGHAFAGLWLEESSFSESVQDDVSLLTKRLAEGSRVIAVVECTLLTAGKNTDFDSACKTAEYNLKSKDNVECFIDVHRSRLSHISPLPVRVLTASGWRVERPEVDSRALTGAPEQVSDPISIANTNQQEFSKKILWERKLLDLGMRNALLNLRLTRSMVPLLSSSLNELEDALADGGDFSIRSHPAEWTPVGGKAGFETLHIVDGYTALLQSEFKCGRLRSSLNETDLTTALKNLYRSAKTDMEENGANTLYMALGLLKWYETDRSSQARYAPLLLLPIEMVRKSAAEGYVIRLRDDEPQMNITLLEKLRQDYSIEIPGLDPLPTDNKGVDTRRVFATIRHGIMNQRRWDVLESACLGIFSFSQFVMWNDIHNRTDDLARSKVVRSLMENHLTWPAQEMHIDGQVPEDTVLLPIPADASQLYAIESAGEGKSFVLHGPPGTGKSQTITALIANALSQGKTVLFVAEKMAALEVVQKRLEKIGLSPFCMELHSNKAKKRDVLEQLRQASEVTKYQTSGEYQASIARIQILRKKLNAYAVALHRVQPCGRSLFSLINDYQAFQAARDITGFDSTFFQSFTPTNFYDRATLVEKLVSAGRSAGHPHAHPLSDVRCKTYSQQMRFDAVEGADSYRKALQTLDIDVKAFSAATNRGVPSSFDEIGQQVCEAECLCALEAFPKSWVVTANPNGFFNTLLSLTEHEKTASACKARLSERWSEALLQMDGRTLLSDYNQQSGKWILGKAIGLRRIRKQLSTCAIGNIQDDRLEQDLCDLALFQQEKEAAYPLLSSIYQELGGFYQGEATNWHSLAELATAAQNAVNQTRLVCGNDDLRIMYGTDQKAINLARKEVSSWKELFAAKGKLYSLLDLGANGRDHWLQTQFELCDRICANQDKLREWVSWNKAAEDAKMAGLGPVVHAYMNGLEHEEVIPAYKKTVFRALAMNTIRSDEALNSFSGNDFNEMIDQFRKIDQELTELAKSEIYCKLAAEVPNFTTASVSGSEPGILQRAIRSGGRGTSIRKLFEQIPNLLPKLCPCMLMSPISVAQYLDPNHKPFDLVVFDEASQVPTSKAIGALARGENAIIVGDPNQMPPTSFFASNSTDDDHLDEEDLESILDDCLALNMPQTHLLWHYRSRHESLIAFSNSQFYGNKLYTFPSVNDRESHVHLVHVDGVFERGGKRVNRAEAEAVIQELKRRCHDPACSALSVGIVTFNINQQNLIDDLLLEACKTDPQLEEWAFSSKEPIFIKNLENVQGDERDVILFSIGYGPDQSGKVSMNFGPLNREGGWRRLNVAVSRARQEMLVFSTLTPDQINLSRTSAEGVAALKEFMEFAASNQLAATENTCCSESNSESGIVDAICSALKEHGYSTDTAIGESAYKIDIGVIDPSNPEKYLLGILLDGTGYKDAKTTRDREIAQINVLQGLGWRIHRVWTMDWWDNCNREIDRVLQEVRRAEKESENSRSVEAEDRSVMVASNSKQNIAETPGEDNMRFKGIVQQNAPIIRKPVETYQSTNLPVSYLSADDYIDPYWGNHIEVKKRVLVVLETESPISESLLTRRVVQSFSIARSGSRIQQYMASVYKEMNLRYTVQNGEKFFWKNTQDSHSYTGFRANGTGENRRDSKDIPIQEAANAVCRALEEQFSLSQEDLVRASANLMGISRIGSSVNALFIEAIGWAEQTKRIKKTENGNWLSNS